MDVNNFKISSPDSRLEGTNKNGSQTNCCYGHAVSISPSLPFSLAPISSQFSKALFTSVDDSLDFHSHSFEISFMAISKMTAKGIEGGKLSDFDPDLTFHPKVINSNHEIVEQCILNNNDEAKAFLEKHTSAIKNGDLRFAPQLFYKGREVPRHISDEVMNQFLPALLKQIGMEDLIEFLVNTKSEKTEEKQKTSEVANFKSGNSEHLEISNRRRIIEIDESINGVPKPFFRAATIEIIVQEIRRDVDRWNSLMAAKRKNAEIEESEISKQALRLEAAKEDVLTEEKDKKIPMKIKSGKPEEPPTFIIDNTKHRKNI